MGPGKPEARGAIPIFSHLFLSFLPFGRTNYIGGFFVQFCLWAVLREIGGINHNSYGRFSGHPLHRLRPTLKCIYLVRGKGRPKVTWTTKAHLPMDFLLKTDAISGSLLVVDFLESLHGWPSNYFLVFCHHVVIHFIILVSLHLTPAVLYLRFRIQGRFSKWCDEQVLPKQLA